jgi:PAS domain-containing protein
MVLSPAKVPPENGENGLADFVDSLPVAVFRESLSGQIVYCNKAFGDLFGFKSCAETVDLSITHLYRNAQDRSFAHGGGDPSRPGQGCSGSFQKA